MYLGLTLNEFLDFDRTAEAQAEAVGRAVGALITKTIKNGGFPFKFTQCFMNAHALLFPTMIQKIGDTYQEKP